MTNAGRNTNNNTPHPPIHTEHEELGHESTDAEHTFIQYIITNGIPLADLEDKDQT